MKDRFLFMIVFLSCFSIGLVKPTESSANTWPHTKCCPTSQFLYGGKVACVNSSVITDNYVIAENAYENQTNLPDCVEKVLIYFDFENSYDEVSVDCIDVHHNFPAYDTYQLVGVRCNSSTGRQIVPSTWFRHINKCCPKYQVFDYERRQCVETNDTVSQNLLRLTTGLSRHLAFFHTRVDCHHALVDYEFESRHFSINNSSDMIVS